MSVSWSQTKENRVAGNATKLKCHLAVFLSVRIKAVMAQILGFITYQLPSPVKKTQNQRQLWEMSVSGDKINKTNSQNVMKGNILTPFFFIKDTSTTDHPLNSSVSLLRQALIVLLTQ